MQKKQLEKMVKPWSMPMIMKLKYIRLNLQEILIIPDVPIGLGQDERPVGAIHIGNKTIFLKKGGYYSGDNRSIRCQIQRDLNDIVKPNWKILYSPDSFGLDQWDYEEGSYLSLGEISYRHLPKAEKDTRIVSLSDRHLPKAEKDARNDTSETLPEVKPVRLTGSFPDPEEIEESH
jgi:hypothetical protein